MSSTLGTGRSRHIALGWTIRGSSDGGQAARVARPGPCRGPRPADARLPRVDPLTFRAATLADVDELVGFWLRAGENASRPSDRPDLVRRLVARDPEAVIVAELDGRIVATVVAGWDGWRANLYRLAVEPGLRGRGLGRRMVQLAEARFRELGAERFSAMVLDHNELGQSLWSAAGYVAQDDWSRWVKAADA
ncbi:GNAT family N-acetyltransferase [Xylanimonas protaetiae]|uniref:GNAT family N-acetyltransferase n=1 Tax=Xylanimonas protaetiae TaxID=2509457 RepID=A0A4P6F786_9MICO|nr:GNAT family N-acetyltransferase [Xylanimonas protaetiae]QAY69097.1 GNAT family N-acetyltransferase [Xylanimonas protaetiae]